MAIGQTRTHSLSSETVHYAWDNAVPPLLEIEPGDEVTFQTRDAGDGYYTPASTAEDVARKEFRGHPLTGPIYVKGAGPGDVLEVQIRDVRPGPYGWTAIRPGRGLLPDDFDAPTSRSGTWRAASKTIGIIRGASTRSAGCAAPSHRRARAASRRRAPPRPRLQP